MEHNEEKPLKRLVEALIFAAAEPITFKDIKNICPNIEKNNLSQIIAELNKEYSDSERAFHIMDLANGWQLVTHEEFADELRELYKHRIKTRLSKPALETLAIISYKQPITKSDIENIRGVNADGMIKTLLNRELIRIAGRQDVPGRPIIYATTDKFLQYFGLASLRDLPKIDEFAKDEPIARQNQEEGAHGLTEFSGKDQHNRSKNPQAAQPEIRVC